MRRALLARHGESRYSAQGLLNGDVGVEVGLTDAGREQARALAERLRDVALDLCVVTEFQRVRETADAALDGREVPRLVVPELNDPLYGTFEGASIEQYRAWAVGSPSSAEPGSGGEGRRAIVARYARGFARVLARPEETVLVVAHSLPISYLLGAVEGRPPAPRAPLVEPARLFELPAAQLASATELLARWAAAPTW